MNHFSKLNTYVFLMISAMISMPLSADERGEEIMQKNDSLKKPVTVHNESAMVIMNGQTREIKEFTVIGKKTGAQNKGRLSFTKPVQMEILTWSQPGKPARQWLKLGAADFQEIAASDMNAPFLGSHFYNEDLADQYMADYDFNYSGDEIIEEQSCYKIEARKKRGLKVYEKKILYVRKSDYFIIRVDFYEKKGHTKTLAMEQIEIIDGIITARKISMTKKGTASKTLVYLKQIEYNKPVSEKLLVP